MYGQDGRFNLGAQHSGMAGASVTQRNHFSLFNNIGGLGHVKSPAIFTSYQNRYGIAEFQVIGGGLVYHTQYANIGIGYFKFGDDLFSQQRIHFAIGNKIQMVSLGLGADIVQYHISTIGSRLTLAVQFGGIADITQKLRFGVHIFNVNQATLVKETTEPLPTVMKGGITYLPSEELSLTVEVEKDLDFEEIIKIGLEYQIIEKVFFRTGINTKPFVSTFGLGFHPSPFELDYSFASDASLGSIHEVSLLFKKAK